MLNDIEDRVRALITDIKSIDKESEGVYLTMGRLFPSLMAETERSSLIAEGSLSSFGRQGPESRDLEAMGAFAAEASAWFRGLHARDAAFLERIIESIDRLAALDGLIQGVRMDSEEMEIISLNAMTVALKSGFAGRAFSVITDELKRLSGQTILLTDTITGRGKSLLEFFGRLRDSLGELDHFQGEFFGKLETNLTVSFCQLQDDLVGASDFFSALIGEAKGIRMPVQRIMQEVQHQDIVRQSLDHVAISLEEAENAARKGQREGASDEDELAFIASIGELSASLLDDIVAKLDSSASSFEAEVNEVESRVARIEERRLGYSARRRLPIADPVDSSGPPGTEIIPADSCLDGKTMIKFEANSFGEASARYMNLKKSVFSTARRLAEQVHVLDDSFKGLATLLARFKNIVVASRIEIAKNKSLGSVTTTVQGMETLTGRIESDVAGAMGTTKDFIKVAMAAISEYAEGLEGLGSSQSRGMLAVAKRHSAAMIGKTGLSATLGLIESDIENLNERRAATSGAIEGFVLFTPEFLAYIGESRRELTRLKGLAERLRTTKSELRNLAAMSSEALGGRINREIQSERLQAMIQRFTILTHKRVAGELANFEVEDGVEVGEVTLF